MRIVIDYDLKFDIPYMEDKEEAFDILKANTVWFTYQEGEITIVGQKIDLDEDRMEQVLDVLDWVSCKTIKLSRYSNGRYSLELE